MGKTVDGETLSWKELEQMSSYIREHGIAQFINVYNKYKDIKGDAMYWGEEVEYMMVFMDDTNRTVKVALMGKDLVKILAKEEEESKEQGKDFAMHWALEFASYMIEGTPLNPYTPGLIGLHEVEGHMKIRRKKLQSMTPSGVFPLTMTSFPLLGVGSSFTEPHIQIPEHSQKLTLSNCIPDELVTPEGRYIAGLCITRDRSGLPISIQVPIYQDLNTKDSIMNLDCSVFGLGMCCLQTTFQADNIDEARFMYDQLTVLAPIFLSLSAATAVVSGRLIDKDTRWDILSHCSDDRTAVERRSNSNDNKEEEQEGDAKKSSDNSVTQNNNNKKTVVYGRESEGPVNYFPKSRWCTVNWYLNPNRNVNKLAYNDVPLVIDQQMFDKLSQSSSSSLEPPVDPILSAHYANLFAKDPVVAYKNSIQLDDSTHDEHFECINSTNWQTVRFKPPPLHQDSKNHIGWRVEFRPMEVQLSDQENAALAVAVILIVKAIKHFGLHFYMKISQVDENMSVAETRDSVRKGQFYWRKTLEMPNGKEEVEETVEKMTIDEIMNGNQERGIKGLLDYVTEYLDKEHKKENETDDHEDKQKITKYIELIKNRAKGNIKTDARWVREFVLAHKEYKQDSVVTQGIAYDLVKECIKMNNNN